MIIPDVILRMYARKTRDKYRSERVFWHSQSSLFGRIVFLRLITVYIQLFFRQQTCVTTSATELLATGARTQVNAWHRSQLNLFLNDFCGIFVSPSDPFCFV